MRKPFIAANWKMNTDMASAVELAGGVAKEIAGIENVKTAVCPPFVYLQKVAENLSHGGNLHLGAQDVYFEGNGAFTGEISCEMLKDVCVEYVITGHSERRHVIGETDELINKKTRAALDAKLLPILCIGELLEEREAGKTNAVVANQVKKGLAGFSAAEAVEITLAYEPVWAIGTGKTATSEQAQEVHAMIRSLLAEMYDQATAEAIIIQYGGSAKPANTEELMSCPDVDGLLVGGAGLKVESFSEMIKITSKLYS
ncbi:Triosephosphate isomerase [Limihaloglobus sulfuriphilus]|uniref:Triosephosphate isomerase n=1 Tax=Limihaloglobus sulfuriphilus TaxID=1851148 RepID=A0A1Q2MBQ2_9BACT|nr:triose-phosphate isomerase [Limihaloglobus sulfuriphilus]AQQ70155.1 Triosephosphate isomerase [Limihaloglobus sulfuriphilus]